MLVRRAQNLLVRETRALVSPRIVIMKKRFRRLQVIVLDLLIEARYRMTWKAHQLRQGTGPDLVVSMTSYPARIKHAWLALESLFRQDVSDFRVVLVLARSQFPGEQLPRMIRRLETKGLEIMWVERDGKSFDHLWPAYEGFPSSTVVSVDDDKFFAPDMISTLRLAAKENPHTIIGWRGWEMRKVTQTVSFGVNWIRATDKTPSCRLFMPPGNGSLYPPGLLPDQTGDHALRERVCPNADDVWFWAMARMNGSRSLCLGRPNHRPVWRQGRTEAISDMGPGQREFDNVVREFKLLPGLLDDLDDGV